MGNDRHKNTGLLQALSNLKKGLGFFIAQVQLKPLCNSIGKAGVEINTWSRSYILFTSNTCIMLVPKSWWVIALKLRGKQHNGKSSELTGCNRTWLQNMWREFTGCSRAWRKPVRWEKDGKEDEAMALSTTLKKVSNGCCTEQPSQLIYILFVNTPASCSCTCKGLQTVSSRSWRNEYM